MQKDIRLIATNSIMWWRDLQTIEISLLIEIDRRDPRDNTRRRSIEIVVEVEVLKKRRSTVIVKKREDTDLDLDLMEDKNSVVTKRNKLIADIIDIGKVPAIRKSKDNVKSPKN